MLPIMLVRATIRGMRSVHCVRAVFTALAGVEGVTRADVALGSAEIEHDGRTTAAAVEGALRLIGYEVIGWEAERRLPVL
jgi:copper chaperone CopZ